MADEEFNFGKKVKKSKKATIEELEAKEENAEHPTKGENEKATDSNLDDLMDFNKEKKKKKNKKKFNMEELEAGLEEIEQNNKEADKENAAAAEVDEKEAAADIEAELDFSMKKKKKKKKTVAFDEEGAAADGEAAADEDNDENSESHSASQSAAGGAGGPAWLNSDRDYTYDELLQLVFQIIKEKNPDFAGGEKRKLVMRPPQVLRVGTKKTSFANFLEICKSLHRPQKHLQAFLLAELGTSGSVDANNQLIIKGRFVQKQIESVLRRYIKDYVACQTCRSPETILQKDTRLFFLQCETCGSRRSVASIKSGYQAVISKRAQQRAKVA